MRKSKGIAGATLLFGPNDPSPDLVCAMQFLVDDLRAEGRRISGLRLSARSLRLRADEFELALTLANGPLPPQAQACVMRPSLPSSAGPDLARARLGQTLRGHKHALGFFLRKRGALPVDHEGLAEDLAIQGRLYLLPVFEAAPPCLVIWQPGALLFTPSEFTAVETATLLTPPDPQAHALVTSSTRSPALRPHVLSAPSRPVPSSRAQRAEGQSAGRLFSHSRPIRPRAIPRIDGTSDRLTTALRQSEPPSPKRNRSALPRAAVAALWGMLLPQLLGGWLQFYL